MDRQQAKVILTMTNKQLQTVDAICGTKWLDNKDNIKMFVDGEKMESLIGDEWIELRHSVLFDREPKYYRAYQPIRKPTQMIGGIECPAPIKEKPSTGDVYWAVSPTYFDGYEALRWNNDPIDLRLFEAGLAYEDENAAKIVVQAKTQQGLW